MSATFAFDVLSLEMLLVLPVIDEFRIDGDDDTGEDDVTGETNQSCTRRRPCWRLPPVAVTLFIDGDDESLTRRVAYAAWRWRSLHDDQVVPPVVPPVAVAVTLVIDGDDEVLYTP